MTIQEGDRVRFDSEARRQLRRSLDYTGLVGEVDTDSEGRIVAWVSWDGGSDHGWFLTSTLELVP